MNNKKRYLIIFVCLFGVILGRIMNRLFSNYFGDDSLKLIILTSTIIVLCTILICAIMGYLKGAIQSFIIVIPLIIIGVGVYLNNIRVAEFGIAMTLIIYPIFVLVMKKGYNK